MGRTKLAALAVLAIGAVVACGPPPETCTPGTTQACACAGGATGAQACLSDGSGFGACGSCSVPQPFVGTWVNTTPSALMTSFQHTITFDDGGAYTSLQMGQWNAAAGHQAGCSDNGATYGTWTANAATLTVVEMTSTVTWGGCTDPAYDTTENTATATRLFTWSASGSSLVLTVTAVNGMPISTPTAVTYTRE